MICIAFFTLFLIIVNNSSSYHRKWTTAISSRQIQRKLNSMNNNVNTNDYPHWFNPDEHISITDDTNIRELSLFPFDNGNEFPTGYAPLNIFVMKFRLMMNDMFLKSEIENSPPLFGIIMSDKETGNICDIGTAVECIDRKLLIDGRQILINVCRQRFKVVKLIQKEPYIIAKVIYGVQDEEILSLKDDEELPVDILDLEKQVYQSLQDVLTLTNKVVGTSEVLSDVVVSLSPPKHLFRKNIASDFSFAVCDLLAISHVERQCLLQCTSLRSRLTTVSKLLKESRELLMLTVSNFEDSSFN